MDIKKIKEKCSNINLLYVEDNRELREIKSKLFSEIFNSVEIASNGYEGLEIYQNSNFELIITDINMPLVNGIEMIQKVKSINPDQAIIVYSAYSELEYVSVLQELNIDKFLTKPVSRDEFLVAINESVENLPLEMA